MIQDILTVKIERNIYVNEEKAVSEIQILINKTFLLFSHHELLMSFMIIIIVSITLRCSCHIFHCIMISLFYCLHLL